MTASGRGEGSERVGKSRRWVGEAPAKTNLLLRVLEREVGGFHALETLFQALEISDGLELTLSPSGSEAPGGAPQVQLEGLGVRLEIDGEEADGLGPVEDNLVVRAVAAFLEATPGVLAPSRTRVPWLRIRLTKRIPHGAGMGGGSSDAAAVLRGLNALVGTPCSAERLLALGGALGSDVPFFLSPSPLALAWSRGQRMLSLPPLPTRPALVGVPPFRVSTPEAYRALASARARRGVDRERSRDRSRVPTGRADPTGRATTELPSAAASPGARPFGHAIAWNALRDWASVAAMAENDFGPVVESLHPSLRAVRERLAAHGAPLALLSGSGSAVIGIFHGEEARDRAMEDLRTRRGWRAIATRTVGGPLDGS